MKKILLGTTAVIALATISTEAFAADPIKLELGGFMRHYIGMSNHDEVAAGQTTAGPSARAVKLQQTSNSEVFFRGATTLDNGLSVSVDIQRESDKSTTNRNDVSSMTVSSDTMGALSLGSTGHAGDDFAVRVPNAGNFGWTDTDKYGAVATSTADSAGFSPSSMDIGDFGGNDGKLKYVTPTFSGVTAYVSYSVGEGANSELTAGTVNRNTANDGYTYGVAYEGEMGGASVAADLTHANISTTWDVNHIGVNVGMSGFTVGGGYSDFSDTQTGSNANDGKSWELGVAYETGPYTLSAGYMVANNTGTATAGDNEDTRWNLAATYDMGAGVALTADYFNSEADAEGAASTTKTSISGVIAGIEVGF